MTPASEPEASCLDTRDRGWYWIIWVAGDTLVTFIPGERAGCDTSQQKQYTLHNQTFKTISTSDNGKYSVWVRSRPEHAQSGMSLMTWQCLCCDVRCHAARDRVSIVTRKCSSCSWHAETRVHINYHSQPGSCRAACTERCNNIISAEKNVKFLIYCSMALCLQTLSCAAGVESWQPAVGHAACSAVRGEQVLLTLVTIIINAICWIKLGWGGVQGQGKGQQLMSIFAVNDYI